MSLFWRFPVSYSVYRLGAYIARHAPEPLIPFGLTLAVWGVRRIMVSTSRRLKKALNATKQCEIRA